MAKRVEWVSNKKRNFENSISDIVSATIRPLLDKNSKLEADIILNWNKIFDSTITGKIKLKKIVFTNRKENKFILHTSVKNVDFMEITHATEIIKEQLTIFLGYKGCERVVVSKELA